MVYLVSVRLGAALTFVIMLIKASPLGKLKPRECFYVEKIIGNSTGNADWIASAL